jgi:hypothetical protein
MVHSFLFIGVSVLHVIEFREELFHFQSIVDPTTFSCICILQSISKRLIWEIYWWLVFSWINNELSLWNMLVNNELWIASIVYVLLDSYKHLQNHRDFNEFLCLHWLFEYMLATINLNLHLSVTSLYHRGLLLRWFEL